MKSEFSGLVPVLRNKDPGSSPGSGRFPREGICYPLWYSWASLVAQLVKNPPAMWETWVRSLVGKIPWRRESLPTQVFWPGEFHGLYSPWGHKESDMTVRLSLSLFSHNMLVSSLIPRIVPWKKKRLSWTNTFEKCSKLFLFFGASQRKQSYWRLWGYGKQTYCIWN